MRRSAIAAALSAASCALALALAAPTMAQEFIASATGPTRGVGISVQTFRFKPFTVRCARARSTGAVTATTFQTLADEVSFSRCTALRAGARFLSPMKLEFNAGGTARIASPVQIALRSIGCVINVPAQSVPRETGSNSLPVNYSLKFLMRRQRRFQEMFPAGQEQLIAASRFASREGLEYTLEGGLCSELEETSGEEGSYSGELLDELVGGNLGIT
jgi:hypothetical protein